MYRTAMLWRKTEKRNDMEKRCVGKRSAEVCLRKIERRNDMEEGCVEE